MITYYAWKEGKVLSFEVWEGGSSFVEENALTDCWCLIDLHGKGSPKSYYIGKHLRVSPYEDAVHFVHSEAECLPAEFVLALVLLGVL